MTRAPGVRAARLVLALALLGSPAIAAGSRPVPVTPRAAVNSTVVHRAWTALVNLAARLGSGMDPDGVQAPPPNGTHASPAPPPPPTADLGSIMDPDG